MEEEFELILKNSTLLLIEDDTGVKESFAELLKLYFKEVFIANNGKKGWWLYNKIKPDVIITDIKMPVMDGIKLIKKIRKINENIPIIVISAYSNQEYLLEAIKLSLIDYILKPIKEENLHFALKKSAKTLLKNSNTLIPLKKSLIYDYKNKVIIYNDEKISLTKKEIELLELLLLNRGSLVTKHYIENMLYVYEEAPPSALKNLIFKLRKKLPLNIIKTHGKLGYLIEK